MSETSEVALKERVEAFMGGVKVASLALHEILRRKLAIGILDEALARRIFEDTGEYITACINELPADDHDSVS